MYYTLLMLPLLGAMVSGVLGRKIGVYGAQIISCCAVVGSAILSVIAFYEVGLSGSPVSIHLTCWIDSEFMLLNWGFLFDSLTVSMLLPVLIVSSLVHIFSVSYMASDPHNQRFFAYLSMFTFFMLVLVTGDNYLVMFVGWEGIGVSSYLLINFWFTRIQANKSAIKALTVNRVGDMFLSIGFFTMFWLFGNLDYSTVFSLSPYMNEYVLTIIGILLLLAAMGKSAQLGLHTWLPDAMEGPTPVSALIHAATLVTAGVYLLLRSSPVLEYAPTALLLITWVGAATAFFAASTGLFQNDIKRVIAYSTCSQMGYLFMAIGISQYNVALFHLVNHAFFKALLFLGAGGVLHSMADQQDMRKLGGLVTFLPFTYVAILIGSLSLMAFPFMTGFFSKDLILELAHGQYEFTGSLVYWAGTVTAMITAFYSLRLISMTFFSVPNAPKTDYKYTHEQPLIVAVPYAILSILAIFFGYLAKDLFVGMGTDFLSSALFMHPNHIALVSAELSIYLPEAETSGGSGVEKALYGAPIMNLDVFYKLLPGYGSIISGMLAFVLYTQKPAFLIIPSSTINGTNKSFSEFMFYSQSLSFTGGNKEAVSSRKKPVFSKYLYTFFNGKYFFDELYNKYIISPALNLGMVTSKVIDKGIVELIGPFGLANSLYNYGGKVAKLDTGVITSYALYIILAVVSLLLLSVGLFFGSPFSMSSPGYTYVPNGDDAESIFKSTNTSTFIIELILVYLAGMFYVIPKVKTA